MTLYVLMAGSQSKYDNKAIKKLSFTCADGQTLEAPIRSHSSGYGFTGTPETPQLKAFSVYQFVYNSGEWILINASDDVNWKYLDNLSIKDTLYTFGSGYYLYLADEFSNAFKVPKDTLVYGAKNPYTNGSGNYATPGFVPPNNSSNRASQFLAGDGTWKEIDTSGSDANVFRQFESGDWAELDDGIYICTGAGGINYDNNQTFNRSNYYSYILQAGSVLIKQSESAEYQGQLITASYATVFHVIRDSTNTSGYLAISSGAAASTGMRLPWNTFCECLMTDNINRSISSKIESMKQEILSDLKDNYVSKDELRALGAEEILAMIEEAKNNG